MIHDLGGRNHRDLSPLRGPVIQAPWAFKIIGLISEIDLSRLCTFINRDFHGFQTVAKATFVKIQPRDILRRQIPDPDTVCKGGAVGDQNGKIGVFDKIAGVARQDRRYRIQILNRPPQHAGKQRQMTQGAVEEQR